MTENMISALCMASLSSSVLKQEEEQVIMVMIA